MVSTIFEGKLAPKMELKLASKCHKNEAKMELKIAANWDQIRLKYGHKMKSKWIQKSQIHDEKWCMKMLRNHTIRWCYETTIYHQFEHVSHM